MGTQIRYYDFRVFQISLFYSFSIFCSTYSETNLSVSLLANGMTTRLVGKATTKPINHPFTKLSRNPAVHPTFIAVIVKVIVESKANVINNAIKNPEYFLLNFKSANHPFRPFHKTITLDIYFPVGSCNLPYSRI